MSASILSLSCCLCADEWMHRRIQEEFADFKDHKAISRKRLDSLAFDEAYQHFLFVKFVIKNNRVEIAQQFSEPYHRAQLLKEALETLCQKYSLPDMEFITSMHDEIGGDFDVPIIVMAKKQNYMGLILIPDFDALHGKYQVLGSADITRDVVPWKAKRNRMIWRGSAVQRSLDGFTGIMTEQNARTFSRVILCEISKEHPELIDAKFTFYAQGSEFVPYVQQFQGRVMPYKMQLFYKYHIMIDGNSCAYSASGWKFFTNSVLFKPNSERIQWYYPELKPYVHYIPVEEDLGDLLDRLAWARSHDAEAKKIAQNAREFALTHLQQEHNLRYLYYTLLEYSKLNFID